MSTRCMVQQQQTGKPVAEWSLAEFCGSQDWRESYRTVGQFMATDLFTVRPDDIVDFAAIFPWYTLIPSPPTPDPQTLAPS